MTIATQVEVTQCYQFEGKVFSWVQHTHKNITQQIPYKQIYWRVKYLAICLKNSVGVILIWQNWDISFIHCVCVRTRVCMSTPGRELIATHVK